MPLMAEAMSKAEWDMMEAGKRIPKRVVEPRPEPEMPKVDGLILFESIPQERFVRLVSAKRGSIKNNDGMSFVGYEVAFEIKYTEGSKKVKKSKALDKILEEEKETYILSGWMPEGEWMKFLRAMRTKIDLGVLQM
jgi:hypothetical protein